jgi:prophage maintenance system killer protein
MIELDVADLVVIASRVLKLDTHETLDLLDVEAAEMALAEARSGEDQRDPASQAAALLHALLRHRPFQRGNEQVALVATVQHLALNGWHIDLDPPEAAHRVIADLTRGQLSPPQLADWLRPRLFPTDSSCAEEAPMRRWLPGRRRRNQAKDPFGRFTDRARRAVVLAQDEARLLHHNYIGTEHLLLGLLREERGVAAKALTTLGISLDAVHRQVEEIIGQGEREPAGHIPFTPRAKKALFEYPRREAMQLGHNYIGTEHLLLGLVRDSEGVAAQVLTRLGAFPSLIRRQVTRLLAGTPPTDHSDMPIRMTVPPELREYREKIADVRRQKDLAIDARDFDKAASLRETEKQLLTAQAQREQEWTAGIDVVAVIDEVERLHHEVEYLRALLRRHGIEPNEGTQRTA